MKLKILTTDMMVASVASRWKNQYYENDKWATTMRGNPELIHEKLLCLGNDATAEDVADIIGNSTWTRVQCCKCLQSVEAAAFVTETDVCCEYCLTEAFDALRVE